MTSASIDGDVAFSTLLYYDFVCAHQNIGRQKSDHADANDSAMSRRLLYTSEVATLYSLLLRKY